MAPNKRSKIKKLFSSRKKRSLLNPSCDSTNSSNLKHLENQQDVVGREHGINVRINVPSHASDFKEVQNPGNETVSKNREKFQIDDSNRQYQSTTSFSQNIFSNASSSNRVQNQNNMTVVRNRNNTWGISSISRQNIENPTVSDNWKSADRMYDFQRPSALFQKNIYATPTPYHAWWRPSLLPLVAASSQNKETSSIYPPTSWSNVIAEPLSKVRNFSPKQSAPVPWCSGTPFNFRAAVQPNFKSFSFNSRNPVFQFGQDPGFPVNSPVPISERHFAKSRRTAFVRPFPLESTAPGFNRISISSKKVHHTLAIATRNFLPPAFANLGGRSTTESAIMPITPNNNSLLKNTNGSNDVPTTTNNNSLLKNIISSDRNLEIIELDNTGVKVDTTSKYDSNDGEVIYLFTVDSSEALVTEVDLISDKSSTGNAIEIRKVTTTPVKRAPKRKLSDNAMGLVKKFNAGEPQSGEKRCSPLTTDKGVVGVADEPQCCVCRISYHALTSDGEKMCAARCGHVFCTTCIRKGISECKTCGAKCLTFHKLFL